MAVLVRMFAALRDAAGTAEDTVEAGLLDDILAELERRHGDAFRRRLAVSTVLVDGSQRRRGSGEVVADGTEIALLPPVSGGQA